MNARLVLASIGILVLLPAAALALGVDTGPGTRDISMRTSVGMGAVVSPGETMSLEMHTSADASVIVFDIDTRGEVHVLYPIGAPSVLHVRDALRLPEDGSDLIVDGERGVEFIFAVAVADPSSIDTDALASLAQSASGSREPYRVEGDPFLAANTIAGDLIRDISRSGASFAYTYFYVSERVDYPCYLCGPCAESEGIPSCVEGHRVTQDFDRRAPMSYPLRRGYDIVEVAASDPVTGEPSPVVLPPDDDDVVVNFYPYGEQVRYVDPGLDGLYGDAWWYDPIYWNYPGWYPYYPGWSFSIGFGWGWGWGWGCWGGYYCSGWYAPSCGGYYPSYPTYPATYPGKFKSSYKGSNGSYSTLAKNRSFAAQKDGDMRIASRDVRTSVKRSTPVTAHTRVSGGQPARTRTGYATRGTKTRSPYGVRDVVRNEMSRGRREAATHAPSKGTSGPRMRPTEHRSNSGAVRSNRSSSGARSHGVQSRPNTSAPHSRSAPASRGGSHSGAPRGKGR